jgi:hypothetical protein
VVGQRRQAFGEVLHRNGSADENTFAGTPQLRVGIPRDIGELLLKEDVHLVLLSPVQDPVEDTHLGIVPIELTPRRLIHALLYFHPAPVQTKPRGVPVELLPRRIIIRGRVGAPDAS